MTQRQKEIINKLEDKITEELKHIREDKSLIIEEKLEIIDVLYDTFKFLDNYEQNVVILNNALNERER